MLISYSSLSRLCCSLLLCCSLVGLIACHDGDKSSEDDPLTGQAAGAAKIDPASVFIPNDTGGGYVTIDTGLGMTFEFCFNVITRLTDHSCEAHVYNGVLIFTVFGYETNRYENIAGTLMWNENHMGDGVMIKLKAESSEIELEIDNMQLQFNKIDDTARDREGQLTIGFFRLEYKDSAGGPSSPNTYSATISITNY